MPMTSKRGATVPAGLRLIEECTVNDGDMEKERFVCM